MLLSEFEFRVAQFLGVSVAIVRDPTAPLTAPAPDRVQLRHTKAVKREDLTAAMHAALAIARAVGRNLRDRGPSESPPSDALAWRTEMLRSERIPTLETVLDDLWSRRIAVAQVEELPAPKFKALACMADARPIILLGHSNDAPSLPLFDIAHECGHLANGDCQEGRIVLDATDEPDTAQMELAADVYAFRLLDGEDQPIELTSGSPSNLASQAAYLGSQEKVDPGHLLMSWARSRATDEAYTKAQMALRSLWKQDKGARSMLAAAFAKNVNLDGASESDYALLSCVNGGRVAE